MQAASSPSSTIKIRQCKRGQELVLNSMPNWWMGISELSTVKAKRNLFLVQPLTKPSHDSQYNMKGYLSPNPSTPSPQPSPPLPPTFGTLPLEEISALSFSSSECGMSSSSEPCQWWRCQGSSTQLIMLHWAGICKYPTGAKLPSKRLSLLTMATWCV